MKVLFLLVTDSWISHSTYLYLILIRISLVPFLNLFTTFTKDIVYD